MQSFHKPLVAHEVTGHVHVSVIDQDAVLLQRTPQDVNKDNQSPAELIVDTGLFFTGFMSEEEQVSVNQPEQRAASGTAS